jgi:hypothetical protein
VLVSGEGAADDSGADTRHTELQEARQHGVNVFSGYRLGAEINVERAIKLQVDEARE